MHLWMFIDIVSRTLCKVCADCNATVDHFLVHFTMYNIRNQQIPTNNTQHTVSIHHTTASNIYVQYVNKGDRIVWSLEDQES